MEKTYQMSINIIDPEYKDMLVVALINQGFQVFFEGNNLCTIFNNEEIKEIDFNAEEPKEENIKGVLQ